VHRQEAKLGQATTNEIQGDRSGQRSFAQPAACLHVPTTLIPEPTKHEARKRRANERHAVGCCEEMARRGFLVEP
jgi:hypothetical protein